MQSSERATVVPKESDGPKENGRILVTRGTVLGIHIGLRWISGRLLNLFFFFVQSG